MASQVLALLCWLGISEAVGIHNHRELHRQRADVGRSTHKKFTSALLTVCFSADKLSPPRHTKEQLSEGCLINIASLKIARPEADVLVITPSEEMVDEKIKRLSSFDPSVKIIAVGRGPYNVSGTSVPLTDRTGKFFGNGLKLIWYSQVLKERLDDYQYVATADGADVFFQRDIFELPLDSPQADLIFFGDRNDRVNKGVEFFRRMMNLCHDPKYRSQEIFNSAQQAFTQTVGPNTYGVYANSGIILGTTQAMYELMTKVVQTMQECSYWKSDQSIVNLARYWEMMRRGDGKVVTYPDMEKSVSMGKYRWSKFGEGGLLANRNKENLYIVHQYDRSPDKEQVTALARMKVSWWLNKFQIKIQ